MHSFTAQILEKNGFILENGDWYSLTSAISKNEALFIKEIISNSNPQSTLEIGCAEGVSSMVICSSISPNAHHTILDPNQYLEWKGMGIRNLKECGFSNFDLIEDYSEFTLPTLLKSGKRFDFVFVDGWHTFDHVLMEFLYINRLLNVGGVVVFDDVALPPLNKLMRYISNYPNYVPIGSAGPFYESNSRKVLDYFKRMISYIILPFGRKINNEFFDDTVLRSNSSLKINGSICAFKKIDDDKRGWAWYKHF